MNAFFGNQEFRYWLRGRNGDETVTISDGNYDRSVRLNEKPQHFLTSHHNISIEFTNDMGAGSDVVFGSDHQTSITAPYYFTVWQCGLNALEDKDSRCERIRNGDFAWGGTYIVIFQGNNVLLLRLFKILNLNYEGCE